MKSKNPQSASADSSLNKGALKAPFDKGGGGGTPTGDCLDHLVRHKCLPLASLEGDLLEKDTILSHFVTAPFKRSLQNFISLLLKGGGSRRLTEDCLDHTKQRRLYYEISGTTVYGAGFFENSR